MKTFIISQADIKNIVIKVGINTIMDTLIDRIRTAFREFDDEKINVPVRSGFEYHYPNFGLLEWMPVMTMGSKAVIKMVGYHPTNTTKRNLPSVLATVSLYDTHSGHLIGMADATFMTALRTGAASAVASEIMAKLDSKILGLIGAGVQGLTQVHALSRIFPIKKVYVYDIDPKVSQSFVQRAAFLSIDIIPIPKKSLDYLLIESDILCTATSVAINEGPVFNDLDVKPLDVKPWLHINAVGTDTAGKKEIPNSFLERSLLVPDFLEQALIEGECQHISPEIVGPTLTEILQDTERCKLLPNQLTIFDSTGWALEDKIAMELLIDYANKFQLGTSIQIENIPNDPLDPYDFIKEVPLSLPNKQMATKTSQ